MEGSRTNLETTISAAFMRYTNGVGSILDYIVLERYTIFRGDITEYGKVSRYLIDLSHVKDKRHQ